MKKVIKYTVIGFVALALIGAVLDGIGGETVEPIQKEEVQEEKASQENDSVREQEDAEKEEKGSLELSEKEQEKYVNGVLDEFEQENEVPKIENPELYNENIVYTCIQKRMESKIKNGVNIKNIGECVLYQNVYETWYPDGTKKKWFAELEDEYKRLKELEADMKNIDSIYSEGITNAYSTVCELSEEYFYVDYEIKKSWLDSAVDFFSGEDSIYYYANDVVNNEFWGEYEGEEEYLIKTDKVLKKSGPQYLYGFFTTPVAVEFSGGFERELPVFQIVSEADIKEILSHYENYLSNEDKANKVKSRIKKIILGNEGKNTKKKAVS